MTNRITAANDKESTMALLVGCDRCGDRLVDVDATGQGLILRGTFAYGLFDSRILCETCLRSAEPVGGE